MFLILLFFIYINQAQNPSYSMNFIAWDVQMEQPDAEQLCMGEFGTHLASIHSEDEQIEAGSLCRTLTTADPAVLGKPCWIGLKQLPAAASTPNAGWYWLDASAQDYGVAADGTANQNWETGTVPIDWYPWPNQYEPNNADSPPPESCVQLKFCNSGPYCTLPSVPVVFDYHWNDILCSGGETWQTSHYPLCNCIEIGNDCDVVEAENNGCCSDLICNEETGKCARCNEIGSYCRSIDDCCGTLICNAGNRCVKTKCPIYDCAAAGPNCACRDNCGGKKCSAAKGGGRTCPGTAVCCCEKDDGTCTANEISTSQFGMDEFVISPVTAVDMDEAPIDQNPSISNKKTDNKNSFGTEHASQSQSVAMYFMIIIFTIIMLSIFIIGIYKHLFKHVLKQELAYSQTNNKEQKSIDMVHEISNPTEIQCENRLDTDEEVVTPIIED